MIHNIKAYLLIINIIIYIECTLKSFLAMRVSCYLSKTWIKKTLESIFARVHTRTMKTWNLKSKSVHLVSIDIHFTIHIFILAMLWIRRKLYWFAIIFFAVGITWEDAPEDQYAVIHKDSKIRCVVKARPAATVDWLKESLIISTGKHFIPLK